MITKEELARQAADEIHGGASAYFVVLGAITAAFAAMPGPAVLVKALEDMEEVRKAVFGDVGDEPDVYADYDRCSELSGKMRQAIEELRHPIKPAPDLASENERMRAALTPSGNTKAAYIGEFSFKVDDRDEDGEECSREVAVPWTTIKEIMSAIREHAALERRT